MPRLACGGRWAVWLAAAALAVTAAAGVEGGAEEESPLFWPPPPEPMRISFVRSVYSPSDLGVRPGFLGKLRQLFAGPDDEALHKPIAVAVDGPGTLYVCDAGRPAVHIFQQAQRRHRKVTSIAGEELLAPVGIAVSEAGQVFVADSQLRKVFCLDRQGRWKFTVGGEERFLRPTGLAVDGQRLYVVDTAAHSVLVFDLEGRFLSQFGERGKGDGQFNYPTAVAADPEGRLYVVDALNFRIQLWSRDHRFLDNLGRAGDGSGSFARPKAVALDSFGHLYVTDGLFDNLQIFSREKEFLLSVGEPGHRDGQFWMPGGLAIGQGDEIYVADSYNQRIQVLRYVGEE